MDGEMIPLVSIGSLAVTPYSAVLAAGCLCAVLVTVLLGRRRPGAARSLDICLAGAAGAVLLGHLAYCLVMIEDLPVDYESGLSLLWKPWLGGYTLFGAVLGGVLAIALLARLTRQKAAVYLDAAAPGACLAIAAGRLAEAFTDQGLGRSVEEASQQFFPLAVCTYADGDYTEWQTPVWFWEALAALAILAVLLWMGRRARRDGEKTEVFIVLLSATQVLLEQLRTDDFLRFGFVRVAQLAALFGLLAVLFTRARREIRLRGWDLWQRLRLPMFAMWMLGVMCVEFAYEKTNFYLWLSLSVSAASLLTVVLLVRRGARTPARCVLAAAALAACAFLCAVIGQDIDAWRWTLLDTTMAACMAAGAWAALGDGARSE